MDDFTLVQTPVCVKLLLQQHDGIAQFGDDGAQGIGLVAARNGDLVGRQLDGEAQDVGFVVHEAHGTWPRDTVKW